MKRILLLSACGGLSSCGLVGLVHQQNQKPEPGTAQVMLTRPGDPSSPATATLQLPGGLPPKANPAAAAATPAGATTGANPMFDFSTAFSSGGSSSRIVNWRRSGSDAAAEARRAERPLFIFFSNHASPTAILMETMFNTAPEAAAIPLQFVPLYIDYADKDTRDSPYYRALQERYKPRGYPVILVALPDGTEVMRQNGYAGESKTEPDWRKRTFQFVTAASTQWEKTAATRRKRLESQGYRTWTNNQGKPVFARLEALDANQATFTGEWGEPFRTFTNRLSESDRQAIEKHNARHQEMPQPR